MWLEKFSAARLPRASAEFWLNAAGDWVEPPNYRRNGFSGVRRVTLPGQGVYYVKQQQNFLFRSLRFPAGRPTLLREWRNIQRCKALGVPTAELEFFAIEKKNDVWHSILVTRALDGYISLKDGFEQNRWAPERRMQVLDAVARTLMKLHDARIRHGHLYPKEIFVCDATLEPAVALVDLELSRRRLTKAGAASADLRRMLKSLLEDGMTPLEYEHVLKSYEDAGIELSRNFDATCRDPGKPLAR